ncbi:MAG: NAD(P)/FAD-dependent oxidoreductase [Gammaproteobacteria bacterium]
MTNPQYDIIIAGSGPAGSTAATLLAQYGHKVLILERDQHPRFHIGESMLPMSTPVFNRMGINWDKKNYLHKNGAQFINEDNGQSVRFCLNGDHQPYQVERSEFDLMMVNNSVKHGATLNQNEAVKNVAVEADAVEVTTSEGQYSSRYFIDATGRSVLMGRQHSSIKRIDNLGRFALYTHYSNACSDAAKDMFISGDIKVLMLDIGWIWIIPLINNRLSIGLVVQKTLDQSQRGPQLFEQYVKASPFLDQLLAGAEQETDIRAEADFSFTNTQRHGERFACCGDAAGFLDPIFSSGVFLAVTSAERIADRLHQALLNATENDPALHAEDDDDYILGFRSMLLFVERFYQYNMVDHLFFEADRNDGVKNDIAALLSGDLWRGDNNFQRMLLEGRQSKNSAC